jgi:ABC-type transport system involved in multi-copper enzyme maturation permease subunit
MPPALLLAHTTLIEARRSGLPWLVLGLLAAALGLAAFLSQVAVTEGRELQAALAAALLRAGAAFLLAAHVAASVVREANDKVLELALALPLSRSQYYLGKLAGHGVVGVGMAAAFAVVMLLWAAPASAALWGASLAAELLLVCAASLFFAVTLANVVPAIAATAGMYLLARSMAAIQLLARGPLAEQTWAQSLARGAVDAVALLLPRLDAATRSDWLLYAPPAPGEFGTAVGALILYTVLLCAAGLFDFHRRNL